jgi:ketosteroid isomerase-like protein
MRHAISSDLSSSTWTKHDMTTSTDTVRAFYSQVSAGDSVGAMAQMARDIGWTIMTSTSGVGVWGGRNSRASALQRAEI